MTCQIVQALPESPLEPAMIDLSKTDVELFKALSQLPARTVTNQKFPQEIDFSTCDLFWEART